MYNEYLCIGICFKLMHHKFLIWTCFNHFFGFLNYLLREHILDWILKISFLDINMRIFSLRKSLNARKSLF